MPGAAGTAPERLTVLPPAMIRLRSLALLVAISPIPLAAPLGEAFRIKFDELPFARLKPLLSENEAALLAAIEPPLLKATAPAMEPTPPVAIGPESVPPLLTATAPAP